MARDTTIGSVTGIRLYPVKSMQGMQLEHGEFTERGIVGDRGYALIDTETGKVASAKSVRLFPDLISCSAVYLDPPQLHDELPPVRITLPNGTSVSSDSADVDPMLSAFFGREVTLARVAPEDFTIDQYHADVEGANPDGHRDLVIEQKLGSAFFAQAGMPSPVPVGSFFDLFPVSVVTTSTLDQLSELEPGCNFDDRRFRMNVIVDAKETGFVENNWVDCELALGDEIRLMVTLPDPRCVMTTLAQDDLPRDTEVMRALVRHNKIQVGDAGSFPCVGVYAVVQSSGTLRIGDHVCLG